MTAGNERRASARGPDGVGSMTTRSRSEAETERAGEALAGRLAPGDIVCLEGDLGAGKTVFVRGLARGLGHDPARISSPSYVLAVEHRGGSRTLLHVDLYRLPDGAGIDDLGIDETTDAGGIVAIEWGGRAPEWIARTAWRVLLEGDGSARTIRIEPPGA